MMARYRVEISQNGWEYTGYAWIESVQGVVAGDDGKSVYAGNVRIEFDEEIGHITKEDE
jgi:hypothetical protein